MRRGLQGSGEVWWGRQREGVQRTGKDRSGRVGGTVLVGIATARSAQEWNGKARCRIGLDWSGKVGGSGLIGSGTESTAEVWTNAVWTGWQ